MVSGSFKAWQVDHRKFFYDGEMLEEPTAPAALYTLIQNTSAAAVTSRIRLRFLYFAFHKCRARFPGHEGITHLRRAIPGDGNQIRKNITTWVFYGKRLAELASRLGGTGCFFVLPTELADTV